ncbi:MAG: type IV pilus secretin PilQ [Acidobacteria bacterium]|nr:type IV pilus secretin PilQ [Acidobacteriota bacterium]
MKIRSTIIRNLASSNVSGTVCAILLLLLAFVVPRLDYAQDKPVSSKPPQMQPNSAAPADSGALAKEAAGKMATVPYQASAITDIKVAPEDGKLTVTVIADRSINPTEIILDNPPRLVLDFPNTRNKVQFAKLPVNSSSLKQVRVQQFQSSPTPIARVVCDLEKGYGAHELNQDESQVLIVFRTEPPNPLAVTAAPTVKAAPSRAQDVSEPKMVTKPYKPLASETPKVEVKETRMPQAESAAKPPAAPTPPPATKPEKAQVKPESPQPAVAKAEPKPAPAEPTVKKPSSQAKPAAVQAEATPQKSDKPKDSPVAAAESKPRPATSQAARNKVDTAPLVAALMPAAMPAPPRVAPSVNTRYTGQPLTLDLIDMPLVDFFRLMAEEGGINVVVDPDVKGTISIKGEKIPWDQVFDMALATRALDKQVEGNLVRITRKATLQEEAKQKEALKKATLLASDVETRVKRLNYAKAVDLVKALADQKTVRGTIVLDERTNSLILTDLPSSLDKLVKLIEALDIPQPQVEIEARIVSATRDFARAIGIQFGFVQGNLERVTVGGPNTFGTIGGTRPSATPNSTYVAGNPVTGRGASESKASNSAAVSTGSSQDKGNYNVNLPATKAFGGLGISIGNIFDTFLLDAAITAGESKGLAKLISQPKVTAQNNSSAVITQGVRFPVQIVANNTVTVQFQNAALTLTVTPQITYEGNIVLDLKVENNTPDWANNVDGIPSIRTSESSTRILVSDGGTTVIGGILIDSESNSEDKVPGLGSLPVVGNLFRRTAVTRSTQEVLFFVTPRIVK